MRHIRLAAVTQYERDYLKNNWTTEKHTFLQRHTALRLLPSLSLFLEEKKRKEKKRKKADRCCRTSLIVGNKIEMEQQLNSLEVTANLVTGTQEKNGDGEFNFH